MITDGATRAPGSRSAPGPNGTTGAGRFGIRSALALAALLAGALPFLALWLLVRAEWSPLATLDGEVAARLNAVVSGIPLLVSALRAVTDLGGTGTAVLLLTLTATFLLIRRQRRLAAFVAASGLGLAVLVPVTKALANRARPIVSEPVIAPPENASFPSGHAMTSLVTWGVLVLLALPAVRRRTRPWLVAAGAVVILAVGTTRLALGVHFVSDVLAGWALGAAWLGATTAAFRGWQHEHSPPSHEPLDPLDVPAAEAPHLVPSPEEAVHAGRDGVLLLAAWATGLFVVLGAFGLLVTGPLSDTLVGRFDRAVVLAFVDLRTETWTRVAEVVGTLAGTRTVVGGGLVLAVVAMAVMRSRRPAVFVVVTLVGEVLLYFLTAQFVQRLRPEAADLTSGLPTGASWPSGHVAAAVALYGALAALVVTHTRTRWRWAMVAVPALVAPTVALSRIYVAAHHPTDVLAGLLLGTAWVLACAATLLSGTRGEQNSCPRPRGDRPHRPVDESPSSGWSRGQVPAGVLLHGSKEATVGTLSDVPRSVLIIEDDPRIRRIVQMTLQREGLEVTEADSGEEALERLGERDFDVILLDLMLPGKDGFEVCREIRRTSNTPVIMVTARSDSHDVVAGLEAGADDYVTKPFVAKELSARIRALARRTRIPEPRVRITVGDLVIAPVEGTVTRDGEPVNLTRTEFRLLCELAADPGRVVSREELLERVWGYDYFGDSRLVDVHVRRLRKKVEEDPAHPAVVTTVRGMGYRVPA